MRKKLIYLGLAVFLLFTSFGFSYAEEKPAADSVETVAVTDIEVSGYQESIKVGKTITLTATVLPTDMTSQSVTYKSADTSVATVSPTGEVTGIAAGKTEIVLTAGDFAKSLPLTVTVAVSSISLRSDYVVLKPGEAYALCAAVTPTDATDPSLTYQSLDRSVATVSPDGVITATACGSTSVIVSNTDASAACSVIVNRTSDGTTAQPEEVEPSDSSTKTYPDTVSAAAYPEIDADMLHYFYDTGKTLTIMGEGYTIRIDGHKIRNCNNVFYTAIHFAEEDGTTFTLNHGESMCAPIELSIDTDPATGNYLYLYNKAEKKYQLVKTDSLEILTLETPGTYLIAAQKISNGQIGKWLLIGGPIVVVGLIVTYIIVKKKYWFW
ncbi:MAG: Ig-like domain-containing protein [Candidatus Fimivivens sp.]|nr:Ig-like domain-containing protein [Candidatus Fimivivens sp.]